MRSYVAIGMLAVASWGASISEAVSAHPGGLAAVALTICPLGLRDNCVVDGDTFLLDGEKVRIADIDAPEMRGRCDY